MRKLLAFLIISLGLGNALHAGISIGSASAVLKQVRKVDEKTLKKKEAYPSNPCVRYHLPCTILGGVISVNTTWTLAKSPYRITTYAVEVASGVTLTIEPGVVVYGDEVPVVRVFGALNAIGTNIRRIVLNDIYLEGFSVSSAINVQFSNINGGIINYPGGTISVKDSAFCGSFGTIFVTDPGADCYIERNILKNSVVSVSNTSGSPIYIRNNVISYPENTTQKIEINGMNPIIIEKNSFLSTDRLALRLDYSTPSQATVINNYWNTTDTAVIDGMIWDHNDDPAITNTLTYTPFLNAPDPATPAAQ